MNNFLTVKEAGIRWKITARMVTMYCGSGRIDGAIKKGNLWLIPNNAEKPSDRRTLQERKDRMTHLLNLK